MVLSIGHYMNVGVQTLEYGLAHTTFAGRLVSWGIFYGALYAIAKKVHQYAWPKLEAYFTRTCTYCKEKIFSKKTEKLNTEPVENKGIPFVANVQSIKEADIIRAAEPTPTPIPTLGQKKK